jgi:hypothetical protein
MKAICGVQPVYWHQLIIPTCTLQAKPKVKLEVEQEECPLFKVLLIGDEEYERDHVTMAIQVRLAHKLL